MAVGGLVFGGPGWVIVSANREPRALFHNPSARPTRPVSPIDRRSRAVRWQSHPDNPTSAGHPAPGDTSETCDAVEQAQSDRKDW